jgi:fibronectin-binding autotransporter adhesin
VPEPEILTGIEIHSSSKPMKNHPCVSRSALLATALVFGPVILSSSASAQSVWAGNTDTNLSTPGNWDVLPLSGDSWTFNAAGSAGLTLANNLTASTAFEVAGISFTNTSGAYVIDSAHTGSFSLTGNMVNASASSVTIGSAVAVSGTRQVNLNGSGNVLLTGNLSGNGSLTQTAGGTGAKSITFSGDNSSFTGTFTQTNDGNNRTAFSVATAGSASAVWDLRRDVAGGIALNFGLGTIHFGSLAGGAQIRNNGAGTTTVSVGALNTSTTFSGGFRSNTGTTNIALTKVGSGTLTLSGSNLHTAATTVQGGSLDVTGTIPNSAITVNSTGTLKVSDGRTINALAVTAGGMLDTGGNLTVTNATSATGANATIDLVNGVATSMLTVQGAAGLTLGGATGADTAKLNVEVGGVTCDSLNVSNGLMVDAGGVSITVTSLGIQANQTYTLATFASGSGAGFATGSGSTVGAITLGNPSLAFGVSGSLEVTANSILLHTSGATPPAAAYWSGSKGSNWSDNTAGQGNFTTTAAGGTFIGTNPGASTQVFFSNNSATNLSNTLGGNFDVLGLTYRGSSAAVTTSGSHLLALQSGGIIVESGNGGATLAMSSLQVAADQTWSNNSSNPLRITASTVTGPNSILTLSGSGAIHLGGSSFSVGTLALSASLDVKGTPVSASFLDSAGSITNTGAADATVTVQATAPATLSGIISDSGPGALVAISKTGADTLLLTGANTYGGGTNASGGILQAGNDSAFGTGQLTISSATATLDLNGKMIANELFNAGATGCVITNSSSSAAAVTTGFNSAGAAGYVISDFKVNGTGDIVWTGSLRRTNTIGVFTKEGANQLTLGGAGVISGMSLVVNEGTVFLSKAATSIQDLTINGGTLKMDPVNQVATANIWSGVVGNTVVMNGGTWDLNDSGTNGVNNRFKRISGTGGTITNNGAGDSRLVLAARDVGGVPSVSWAGNIQDGTGKVALSIVNGGSAGQVMIFTGAHSYSGDTTIQQNVMRAGAANVLSPSSHFVIDGSPGSTLDLNGFNNTIGSLAGGSAVLLGAGTLTTNAKDNADTIFQGVISGTGGLIKQGTGTLMLNGTNTYSGDTVVNAGTLAVDGDSLLDAGKLVIEAGAVIDVIGTEVVGSLFFGGAPQASGTWGASGSGATNIDDTRFSGAGMIHVGAVAGYENWADANAGGQTADQDFDGDGVDNGIEYFMNSTAGFTANPGVDGGVVTWPNGGNIASSAYGTQFVIKTSTNLNSWEPVLVTDPRLGNTAGSVSYTLPTGAGKIFVRLEVTPE